MLKFYVKVISKHCDYLVHVWYDDRYWSKILCSTIPTPVHDLKVKVRALDFLCKSSVLKFLQCTFLHSLCWIWFMFGLLIDRYWSKILCGTIRIPVHDPKVKVTD